MEKDSFITTNFYLTFKTLFVLKNITFTFGSGGGSCFIFTNVTFQRLVFPSVHDRLMC